MPHRRTGSDRGGKHSEVTEKIASLVFGILDHLSMDEFFLELLPRNSTVVHRLRAGSQTQQQGTHWETAYYLYVRVAAEAHSRVSVENAF